MSTWKFWQAEENFRYMRKIFYLTVASTCMNAFEYSDTLTAFTRRKHILNLAVKKLQEKTLDCVLAK